MGPIFFNTSASLRKWLDQNHAKETEVWVGFYKTHTGKKSISWSESVDQALCFGWIDGIRKSIDDESYMIRFTPRKPKSIWSAVNIKKVKELTRKGLMKPAGSAAYEKREDKQSAIYSFEQGEISFRKPQETTFKANKNSWAFFLSQPPSYRKAATWWVISAKQEATRQKRLVKLIRDSEEHLRVKHLRPIKKVS